MLSHETFVQPDCGPQAMHGGLVDKKLPARPNLDHLRRQAKTLLAQLKDGMPAAVQAFIDHLPEARQMRADAVRAAGFRLADAQSVVARQSGFPSWPALSRHVEQLRSLEGDWRYDALEIDGAAVPAAALTQSRLLFDGDRFRVESPEGTYEGVFAIDADARPPQISIEFVEGPEAGNRCDGLYELDGDRLTLCLGVVGASRPTTFATRPGSGHALERLRRASAARPANVTGGTPPPAALAIAADREDPVAFDQAMTPLMRRLEGEWIPVHMVRGGKPLPDAWLAFGSRTTVGNEVKIVFGGQVMLHAKVRIDERATPTAVDYLHLDGAKANTVSRGIMEWVGDDVRFLTAAPGQSRPADFDAPVGAGTLSQWRRR
jgi:uncharacterized protein (TIGR03067 family)